MRWPRAISWELNMYGSVKSCRTEQEGNVSIQKKITAPCHVTPSSYKKEFRQVSSQRKQMFRQTTQCPLDSNFLSPCHGSNKLFFLKNYIPDIVSLLFSQLGGFCVCICTQLDLKDIHFYSLNHQF